MQIKLLQNKLATSIACIPYQRLVITQYRSECGWSIAWLMTKLSIGELSCWKITSPHYIVLLCEVCIISNTSERSALDERIWSLSDKQYQFWKHWNKLTFFYRSCARVKNVSSLEKGQLIFSHKMNRNQHTSAKILQSLNNAVSHWLKGSNLTIPITNYFNK